MRGINNILFKISIFLTICGMAFIVAQLIGPANTDLAARIIMAAGCILLIVSMAFRKANPTVAYADFSNKAIGDAVSAITFNDVAANTEAKASLSGLVDYIKHPEKYASLGARMPRGVLLYGPPGTGKTLLARALAGEAGVPFFALSGSDFVQMYVGVGASRVRELFTNARKAGKCVIFIDEIDALGKRRSDTASEERDQTLNALLSEMSGFKSGEGIIVLAATNRIETLDSALTRPVRFDRQIEVGLPGVSERLDILKLHCRNKPISSTVDLNRLAHDTYSFSGASLEALLNEAAICAVQRKSAEIEKSDIDKAFYMAIAGDDGKAATNAEERCAVAVHEAGHAVVMKKLIPSSNLKRISILSANRGAAGYNLAIPEEHTLLKKSDIENQIAVLLAGRAAELLVGGDKALTSGASGDLQRAAELASSMIMDLGMGDDPAVSLRALSSSCGGISGSYNACREKLDEMYNIARAVLEEDIGLLMSVTEALLNYETLDESAIANLFNANQAFQR